MWSIRPPPSHTCPPPGNYRAKITIHSSRRRDFCALCRGATAIPRNRMSTVHRLHVCLLRFSLCCLCHACQVLPSLVIIKIIGTVCIVPQISVCVIIRKLPLAPSVKKGKGSPYSITKRRVPELIPVLGIQPESDVSHKPGGRLPLFSTRPAVILATLQRTATNFATR